LIVLVQPEKSEVSYANGFPVIGNLAASAINDVADFVCHNELNVLGSQFISNEQTVFYLDGSYHFLLETHLLGN
jgi:hypothetical protein